MVQKQMSGVASNKLSGISPSNGAKQSSLISQMRTTSHGDPSSKDEQHYGGDHYTTSDLNNGINKAGNSKNNNPNNNGLAMSQTRTTTHTSN